MRTSVLTFIGVAAVLATIVLGRDLLDVYHLQKYITSSAVAYEANRGPWPQVSDACAPCHGPNGNSVNQSYPALAAQPSSYLIEQLRNFASGQRANPIMNQMVRSLKEGEIPHLANYFSQQSPIENRYFVANSALRREGEQIVRAGRCAACHGKALMGQGQSPRLAGQGYDYLKKQLDEFAGGTRRDPSGTMNPLASSWSSEERRAIATVLASSPILIDANLVGGEATVAEK